MSRRKANQAARAGPRAPGAAARVGGSISDGQLDLALRRLDRLPVLPAIAGRLLELALRPEGDWAAEGTAARQTVELAVLDMAMTAGLVRQANQAAPDSARTAADAASKLGPEAVRAAALTAGLSGLDNASPPGSRLDRVEFWKHCLATAHAAKLLAERIGLPIDPMEAFTCGLLHDVGKLAMDELMPKSYARAIAADAQQCQAIADSERKIIGADHCVFGRRLAEMWRLGAALEAVIWLHHQPADGVPGSVADRRLVDVIALADAIARRAGIGFSGNYTFPRAVDEWAKALGMEPGEVDEIRASAAAAVAEAAERLGHIEAAPQGREKLIARASAELVRMNEHLRRGAARAAAEAKAFRELGEFASSLTGQSSVAEVVGRIAAATAAALDLRPSLASPVVAYAFDDTGEPVILAVRHDGGENPSWRTLACAGPRDSLTAPRTAGPAPDAMAALLAGGEDMADWIDLAACVHQPLICAGEWAGGVLIPSAAQGPARCADDSWARIVAAMAMALSLVQARSRAVRLNEQLTGASQVLAAAGDALAEAKTLTAIGEMAAGAAHELNNPLAIISGRAQLMAQRADQPEQKKVWAIIVEQAQRISDIISELMECAAPAAPSPQSIDPRELLRSAAASLAAGGDAQAASASVDIDIEEAAPPIRADRGQLETVLVELLRNAAAAGGPEPKIRLSAAADRAKGHVVLCVEDNGAGMDEQTLASAFTPFYSNRPAGRRRGLGLAKAKRLVEINGGTIRVTSAPGAGTEVFVAMPAADEPSKKEQDR
ncbi:MAG: HDOD domain-containing protein [Phycisphaerae bacterium]